MTPNELERWRNEVLARPEDLHIRARQIGQVMDAKNIPKMDDVSDFEAAWDRIEDMFPEDFRAERAGDLNRHIHFAMRHDFSDIEEMDIPAVMESVRRYGRRGQTFIKSELDRLTFGSSVDDIIHPRTRDACAGHLKQRAYREAARTCVGLVMDEFRRLAETEADGDSLIRQVVRTRAGGLAFSDCQSNNARQVTEGVKLIAQGLYKGVRNPASHGWNEFGRVEVIQIMSTCSLLITRLQIVKDGSATET